MWCQPCITQKLGILFYGFRLTLSAAEGYADATKAGEDWRVIGPEHWAHDPRVSGCRQSFPIRGWPCARAKSGIPTYGNLLLSL